jgi:hypothetical protein
MPGSEMVRPDGNAKPVQTVIDRAVSRLIDDVVDKALTQAGDRRERGLVRDALAGDLRALLAELAESQTGQTNAYLLSCNRQAEAISGPFMTRLFPSTPRTPSRIRLLQLHDGLS